MFGVKDVFTTINLLGGAVAIFLCIEGRPFAAGVAILVGFLGDVADGIVARALKSANRFGAEYDTISDHLSHCIAPAAIVFTVYREAPFGLGKTATTIVAMAVASSIIVAASVRHARNIVAPVEFKGAWAGLPRTVLGFLPLALVNSSLLPLLPGFWWVGAGVIVLLGVLALSYIPYPNHRLPRKHHIHVRVLIGLFFASTFGVMIVRPAYTFDVLFVFMFGYAAGAWSVLTPEERRRYREVVQHRFGPEA